MKLPTGYMSALDVAHINGVTVEHIYRQCKEGNYPGVEKVDGQWRIPKSCDAKFMAVRRDDLEDLAKLRKTVPKPKVEEALQRLAILRELESFMNNYFSQGGNRSDGVAVFVAKKGLSTATLNRWIVKCKKAGLVGLVDGRGRPAGQLNPISPEAWQAFNQLYLDPRQMSVKLCWQMVNYHNKSEGHGWQIPSLRTMYNLVKTIPQGTRVLHREGTRAYEALCSPYIISDPDSVEPGEVWVGDHSQFNCWVRYKNKWIRPWITAWQDMRSRMIVGFDINAGPNQTTILRAFKRAVEEYGLPESAKIDNGKDYDSEMWTGTTKKIRRALRRGYLDEGVVAGIYALLGIDVSFTIPYNAKAKRIERFFDTLDCQFVKAIPTWCGKTPFNRPENLDLESRKTIAEGYPLDEFTEKVGEWIDTYNRCVHSGAGMDGQSPLNVFNTRSVRREAEDGAIDLLCRVWSGELTVGKNGVKFRGVWWGQYDQILLRYQGRRVRVSYDPDDIGSIDVWTADYKNYLVTVEQAKFVAYGPGVSDGDLREGMRQQRRAKKIAREYRDTAVVANMGADDLTIKANVERTQPQVKAYKKPQIVKAAQPKVSKAAAVKKERAKAKKLRKAVGAYAEDIDLDWIAGPREGGESEELDFDISLLWNKKDATENG